MDAWPPCPRIKRGAHSICAIIPDTAEHPAILFCDKCGMHQPVAIDLPRPVDDWTAADIAALRKPG